MSEGPEDATCTFAVITSRQRVMRERLLHQLALNDALTGLPNRSVTHATLHRELHRRDAHHPITVLFIDVNRFKAINDQYGHAAGDAVLREIARRLSYTLRAEDLLTRFAGTSSWSSPPRSRTRPRRRALCRRLADSLSAPIDLGERRQLIVSVSIGGVLARGRQCTVEQLLAHADAAMFAAKTTGDGHRIAELRSTGNR